MIKVTKTEWAHAVVRMDYTYTLKGKDAKEFKEGDIDVREEILFNCGDHTYEQDVDSINDIFDFDIDFEELQPECDMNYETQNDQ